MTEKDLERQLCEKLRAVFTAVDMPAEFFIHNSTSDAKNLFDLIGNKGYELIEDDSRWNLHPKFMLDIIGGMTPDIGSDPKAPGRIASTLKSRRRNRWDTAKLILS